MEGTYMDVHWKYPDMEVPCMECTEVQRLYVDTEATMLELDQILRANELSISIVAAVPALAVGWLLLMAIMR
eukprot:gene10700-12400_t